MVEKVIVAEEVKADSRPTGFEIKIPDDVRRHRDGRVYVYKVRPEGCGPWILAFHDRSLLGAMTLAAEEAGQRVITELDLMTDEEIHALGEFEGW